MHGSLWQKDESPNQYQITLSKITEMVSTIMSVYVVHGWLYPMCQSNTHLIFTIVEELHGHPQCAHAANSMVASH